MLSGVIGAFGFGVEPKNSSNPAATSGDKGDFATALAKAQNSNVTNVTLAAVEKSDTSMTAVEKFMKYQEMTPAEKLRASYLSSKGLTEEDVAAMTPEERTKLEKEIEESIKRQMGAGELDDPTSVG